MGLICVLRLAVWKILYLNQVMLLPCNMCKLDSFMNCFPDVNPNLQRMLKALNPAATQQTMPVPLAQPTQEWRVSTPLRTEQISANSIDSESQHKTRQRAKDGRLGTMKIHRHYHRRCLPACSMVMEASFKQHRIIRPYV